MNLHTWKYCVFINKLFVLILNYYCNDKQINVWLELFVCGGEGSIKKKTKQFKLF